MLDTITQNIMSILAISIGGISIGTIIGFVIYGVRAIKRNKREIKITKEQIEEAFKSAVFPKNLKLDVSSKIQQPIKDGLENMKKTLSEYLEVELGKMEERMQMILSILSKFATVDKLTNENKEKLFALLNKEEPTEIQL